MVGDFSATCRKRTGQYLGQTVFTNCDEQFTDRAEFEAHMVNVHKAPRLTPGRRAPGWRGGQIEPPHPWKAPRPNAARLQAVLEEAEALGLLTIDHPQEERKAA
jgi:hypothetical protein